MSTIALVVVTHNSAAWLEGLVRTWHITSQEIADTEVVIADSGSSDTTISLAQKLLPEAKVITCGDVGFGTAANRAIEQLTAPWILLCNPDLEFSPNFLDTMLHAATATPENTACLAPQLLNPNGTPQPSVGKFPTIRQIIRDQFRTRERRKYLFPQPSEKAEIQWASAACLLLRRAAFQAVGGFDEKYFLYGEEVDLQHRLHAAGQKAHFVPSARVKHLHPNATRPPRPEVQRYAALGMLRYFAKFAGPGTLCAYRLMALTSGRLAWNDLFISRNTIVQRPSRITR